MVCFYFERFAVWLNGDFLPCRLQWVKQTHVIEIQTCKHVVCLFWGKLKVIQIKRLNSTGKANGTLCLCAQTIYYERLVLTLFLCSGTFLRTCCFTQNDVKHFSGYCLTKDLSYNKNMCRMRSGTDMNHTFSFECLQRSCSPLGFNFLLIKVVVGFIFLYYISAFFKWTPNMSSVSVFSHLKWVKGLCWAEGFIYFTLFASYCVLICWFRFFKPDRAKTCKLQTVLRKGVNGKLSFGHISY